ncbi:MAG TPA: oligogalacturonate lyase family protein [Verrucomicrobiae bacterium]|nr:oligogalacturonate lyase family protein [Verrucomicrobiae bacterium]
MLRIARAVAVQLVLACFCFADPPRDWVEPITGHRVVRLSREPGSASLYFHQNAYTAEGDKLLVSTPSGLATVNLTNYDLDIVVPHANYSMGGSSGIEVARKSRQVYYSARGETGTVIRATHLDTKATHEIVRLPFYAAFNSINADETLLVGTLNERRSSNIRSMKFYAVNVETGELKFFNPSTNWLNHVQCSPTDPTMLLFCHEGSWHDVDRVWTVPIGGDNPRLMHKRTLPFEIAGHEFFSRDGNWVWYDLQTPRAKEFSLAGVHIKTGERIRYALSRSEWSVHYNISSDGKLFAGDGGGPNSVANRTPMPENKPLHPPGNGQWIYLFRPSSSFETNIINGEPVKVGRLGAEKLVDLSKHNYQLEPNVTFTPNAKWIVFRSNMQGERHIYAVEVAKHE